MSVLVKIPAPTFTSLPSSLCITFQSVANSLNVSHPTFNIISPKFYITILNLSTTDLGFGLSFNKDVINFGDEAILRSTNIISLVKK